MQRPNVSRIDVRDDTAEDRLVMPIACIRNQTVITIYDQ